MRIGIDISSATPGRTGIGTYTFELARRLIRERRHDWVLLFNSLRQPPPDWPELRAPNVQLRVRRVPGPMLLKAWQWFDFPSVEKLAGGVLDLFHAPATYIPPQKSGLRLATIHDTHFMDTTAALAPLGGEYLKWILQNRANAADVIICDSPSVAREVAERLTDIGPRRFDVREIADETTPSSNTSAPIFPIPLGVDPQFFNVDPPRIEELRNRCGLPERFVLHVGGFEPRKNLSGLLTAYARAALADHPLPDLVLAGATDADLNTFLSRFERSEKPSGLIYAMGYVPHEDLPALYAAADALLFPSLHEGFGLPVLEAMACGCPVITSRETAATEFLPDGCVAFFDSLDADAIAETLWNTLQDTAMLERLGQSGPGIAAEFTWEKTAEQTIAVYEQMARAR